MQSSEGSGDSHRPQLQTRVSQLSKPLWNCLHDQSPLSILEYFIQFMAAGDALHLLQFWFSVASFRNAIPSCATTTTTDTTQMDDTVQQHCTPVISSSATTASRSDESSRCETSEDTQIVPGHGQAVGVPGFISQSPIRISSQPGDGDGESGTVTGAARGVSCVGTELCMNDIGQRGGEDGGVAIGREEKSRPSDITRQPSLNVVTDAMGIYSTYIALNALTPVHIPDDVRQRVEVNICPENGVVDRNCFNEAQHFIYNSIERRYYPDFLRSSFLCKYQLEVIASGGLSLLDFLLGGDSLIYFMEFMEAENALSMPQFWLTAESFRVHVATTLNHPQCNVEVTVEDAIAIYDRYFSMQATEPLGMGDRVRVDIEMGICNERGPQADSFVTAQRIAYDRMNENYYPHFLESGIYLKFLDSLLHMVKLPPDHQTECHIQTDDRSSHSETKTVIDYFTYDVDNLESLWQRPQLMMRLGTVDSMGQYTSEINPFPTKTKDHFRWFRNRQEEEWELAVKVSRAIVAKVLRRTSRKSHKL